uniref:Uncharacterized protein n=1 Tax=Panagrolaimus sp. ES5 TaxID=591445 RepID=A0AC34FLW2_9BILA
MGDRIGDWHSNFENFLHFLLATDMEAMDSFQIRQIHANTPHLYVPLESHYELMIEVLLKMKSLQNRAVYNDTLAFFQTVFEGVDYNVFLIQWWEELSRRSIAVSSISYSRGQTVFTYSECNCDFNSEKVIDKKVKELAWALLIDTDASIKFIMGTVILQRKYFILNCIILRKFACLGDHLVLADESMTPLIMVYFRQILHLPDVQNDRVKYEMTLSLLVSISWHQTGSAHTSSIRPNDVLQEIVFNLIKRDENFVFWVTALSDLFFPRHNFSSAISFTQYSLGYHNSSNFFAALLQIYDRGNPQPINQQLKKIIYNFKTRISSSNAQVQMNMFDERIISDWLFSFHAFEILSDVNFRNTIPRAVFHILPLNRRDSFIPLPDTEATLEQALIGVFELYFVHGLQVGEDFYKNIWTSYSKPTNFIESVAEAAIHAWSNLKDSCDIHGDKNFSKMVEKICSFADKSFLHSMSSLMEMDSTVLFEFQHVFVIGRVARKLFEGESNGQEMIDFAEINPFTRGVFNTFAEIVTQKYNQIRDRHFDEFPPWRRDYVSLPEDKQMAYAHALEMIRKEAFVITSKTRGEPSELVDLLVFLEKKQKVLGINFGKVDSILFQIFPRGDDDDQ